MNTERELTLEAKAGSGPQSRTPEPVEGLVALLARALESCRERAAEDPFSNAVDLVALRLFRELRDGRRSLEELETLLRHLTLEAFCARARHIARYLGPCDPEANETRLRELLSELLLEDGAPVPVEEAASRLERIVFGFVFTAHPTFSLARELQEILISLAVGRDERGRPLDEARRAELLARAAARPHRPDADIDLAEEQRQALAAIANLQRAIRRLYAIAFELCRELYPDAWRRVVPRLVSIASWVGYDTDGRADIPWTETFHRRLLAQIVQLEDYRARIAGLRGRIAGGREPGSILDLLEARLAITIKSLRDVSAVLAGPEAKGGGEAWLDRLAAAGRELAATQGVRFRDRRELTALLTRALEAAEDEEIARELWILRGEAAVLGLAAARTHLRINAVQLHNAVRNLIAMEHPPEDPTWRLTYLEAIARLIAEARPVQVNLGSLAHESATARRAFMMCAQLLRHVDAGEPIRFLIAECETPFTILCALYFARLFGVADRIDISPLFETRKALERGAAIIDEALSYPAYREYLLQRGRLCIQTGFSDAGRYMGQIAASVAIERIRIGLAEVLARHGLSDLELVIFDTHGESIGRGAHPDSLRDRLLYYDTPYTRRLFAQAGIRQREETSFQGGDGYLLFCREESALAALTRVLEHRLRPPPEDEDPFYTRRVYVDEFFASVRQFNARLLDDPDYAAFLGAFGTNLLHPTGSRATRRQHERVGATPPLEHAAQLRAIPHNAILQQLGILVHVIGGVGRAMARDPQRFEELYRESDRFRRLISMVEHAFKFTDPRVTQAYLDLFDAGRWLWLAGSRADAEWQEALRAVAEVAEMLHLHDRLARVFRFMLRDYLDLARALREHRRKTRDAGEEPIAVDAETRDNLHLLHALRLALVRRLMLYAVELPDFSDRHAVTRDEIVAQLFHLDVEPVLELLARIFPLEEDGRDRRDYGEPASEPLGAQQSYAREHETLFRPMGRIYELLRRITTSVSHHIGAIG